jgi:general secretion pathway protein E
LGRIGIFEVMRLSSALMGHITESPELGPLRKSAMREGMRSLRASGAEKVKAGLTSVAEVLAVVQS